MLYFPICTRIFDERPLNVKTAVNLAGRLKQKDVLADNEDEKPSVILKNVSFAYSKMIKIFYPV